MESASASVPAGAEPGGKGLKANAIGYLTNLVISIASVAPAYSLAATWGSSSRSTAWACTPRP